MARSSALDLALPCLATANPEGTANLKAGGSKGNELRAIAVRYGQGLRGKPRTGRRHADDDAAGKSAGPSRSAFRRTAASASRWTPRHRFGAGPNLLRTSQKTPGGGWGGRHRPRLPGKSLFDGAGAYDTGNRQALLANSGGETSLRHGQRRTSFHYRSGTRFGKHSVRLGS
jgi:hypothetical protein